MENRFQYFLLMASLVMTALGWTSATQAGAREDIQDVIEPDVKRRLIHSQDIDSENFELGVYGGLMSVEDFGSNGLKGLRLAFHATEDVFLEAAYAETTLGETSAETVGGFQLLTDDERELSYYNMSLGYNVLPGEAFVGSGYAFTSAFYLIAGAGNVQFASDDHFALNAGVGYRLLVTDWLAIHVDMRDHLFDSDILGKEKTLHNLELTSSVTVFF